MRSNRTLFIRADASVQIGTGHVMRMLALAQAWQDHHAVSGHPSAVHLLAAHLPDALSVRIENAGVCVHRLSPHAEPEIDAAETITQIRRVSGADRSWVVADGYHFGEPFQQVVSAAGYPLAIMDDNAENQRYVCDLIVNQNIMAHERMYAQRLASTRLLLGTRYALLRREFRVQRITRIHPARVGRVLLSFGGGDTAHLHRAALEQLATAPFPLEIRCVLGALGGREEGLERAIASSRHRVEILRDVPDMAGVMQDCDLAICAAGSTTWECCAMELPIITVVMAENQRQIAVTLCEQGCALPAGGFDESNCFSAIASSFSRWAEDPAARSNACHRAHALVDGHGALRVAAVLSGEESER